MIKKLKYIFTILLILTFKLGFSQDGKSLILIHNYADKAAIDAIANATEGNIAYAADENAIYVFDGTVWILSSNSNWSVTGNTGLNGYTSFLGHTDDQIMRIGSNGDPMLQFGRRGSFVPSLVDPGIDPDPDYSDVDQPLVYLNGDGTTAALQFQTSAGSQYPPLFFSTANGSFRLKGSSAETDLFEIGSAGPTNEGMLEFIVGDDGDEPMIFKRFHYANGGTTTEMFRVQGSTDANGANEPNIKTRFGININQARGTLDTTYDTADSGDMANSTLQVEGSLSKSLVRTADAAVDLDEDHYSVIVTNAAAVVTLPTITSGDVETDLMGREYVIKNTTTSDITISSYQNNSDTAITTIPANNVLKVQSDGTLWNQMNNYTSYTETCITEATLTEADPGDFDIEDYDDTGGNGNANNTRIEFENNTGTTITELQILISNVPFSEISIDSAIITGGGNANITTSTTPNSSDTCNGNDGNFDHLITITGISFQNGSDIEIEFDKVGGNGTDDEDVLSFYYD